MDEPDETMSLQRKVATKDGVRKVICDHVRAGNTDTAKTMSRLVDDIATAAREKLEVAFSIRRPRK